MVIRLVYQKHLLNRCISGSGIEQEDKNEVTLLLVARGSSDPEVLRDINWIASLFQTKEKVKKVEVCYLAAAGQNLRRS